MQYSQQKQHIDEYGYRKNVGIIVCNHQRQLLWARRARRDGWQFPQGGVEQGESVSDAVFRELYEEIGLTSADVKHLGNTKHWLRYDVPRVIRKSNRSGGMQFRGQKQRWFLFYLLADESNVKLDATKTPEFVQWKWVDYWLPQKQVVAFKRGVYQKALTELEPFLACIGQASPPVNGDLGGKVSS